KDGKYVSVTISFGGTDHRAVSFGSTYDAFPFSEGDIVDILANLDVNEYNDRRNINILIKDMRYSGFRQERYFAARTAYEDYRCGKVESRLLARMIPEKDEQKKVYDILRGTQSLSKAEMIADRAGINCCKFRIILDIFGEFGLAETDVTKDSVRLIPVKGKVDLEKSRVITNLRRSV
ncbi:MAG: hypothetical protein II820_04385, partial [Ruminiclostridium sp.]|nr:hypothetical protein [Ruminiclostridium sp.]